jgi:hypothetical protein
MLPKFNFLCCSRFPKFKFFFFFFFFLRLTIPCLFRLLVAPVLSKPEMQIPQQEVATAPLLCAQASVDRTGVSEKKMKKKKILASLLWLKVAAKLDSTTFSKSFLFPVS